MTTKLLKAEKVAEMLDITKARVYFLSREKKLPTILVGDRQYRYSEAAIVQWIENGGSIENNDSANESIEN